jgi:hypothetical protein
MLDMLSDGKASSREFYNSIRRSHPAARLER